MFVVEMVALTFVMEMVYYIFFGQFVGPNDVKGKDATKKSVMIFLLTLFIVGAILLLSELSQAMTLF